MGNHVAAMVDIAQQVEHLIVVQKVARSNRVIHPIRNPYGHKACRGFLMLSSLPNSPTCVSHAWVNRQNVGLTRRLNSIQPILS